MIHLPESVKALINHISEDYHLKNLKQHSQVKTIQSLSKQETDVTSLNINLSFEEGPICYNISIQTTRRKVLKVAIVRAKVEKSIVDLSQKTISVER